MMPWGLPGMGLAMSAATTSDSSAEIAEVTTPSMNCPQLLNDMMVSMLETKSRRLIVHDLIRR